MSKLDENGKPLGIVVKESKESHQLIEEFMLLANRAVAEYVSKIKVNQKALPFPYRIHDQPDAAKLLPFAAFARKFGYTFDLLSHLLPNIRFNLIVNVAHSTLATPLLVDLRVHRGHHSPVDTSHRTCMCTNGN
jgi:ribonuclease R